MAATPKPASHKGSSLAPATAGARVAATSTGRQALCTRLSTLHRQVGLVADVECPPAPGCERALQVAEGSEVVDRAKPEDSLAQRRAAEEVARKQRDHGRADAEVLARRHEDVAQVRVGHAVDEPRELLRAVDHHPVEAL